MKILDATCGFRGIWYQKNHPFVTFMDKRKEVGYSNHKKGKRRIVINPDVISEWKDAPFPDNHFDIIIFDPPHLIWKHNKKENSLDKSYGHLREENWRQELQQGIKKLFEILKPQGIFILKWCENSKKVEEVLKLCPYPPLFGSNTKSKGHTSNFWILFLKHDLNQKLDITSNSQGTKSIQFLPKNSIDSPDNQSPQTKPLSGSQKDESNTMPSQSQWMKDKTGDKNINKGCGKDMGDWCCGDEGFNIPENKYEICYCDECEKDYDKAEIKSDYKERSYGIK